MCDALSDAIRIELFDGLESRLSDAALAEIAENLHRREISEIERAELLDRWIKHREAKRAEAEMPKPPEWLSDAWDEGAKEVSAQVGPKPKGGRPEGGVRQASRELGVSRQNLQRATKIAALSDEAKAAAKDGGLDGNQSALLRAAKEPTPDRQVREIERRNPVGASWIFSNPLLDNLILASDADAS